MRKTGEKHLKTSDLARAAGVHPNTIRLFEGWGMLPPVDRGANGYRQFTQTHLEQLKLVRLALRCTCLGGSIRQQALKVIHTAAKGDIGDALRQAEILAVSISIERKQAEEAEKFLEAWVSGNSANVHDSQRTLQTSVIRKSGTDGTSDLSEAYDRKSAAKILDVSIDMLRDWERNGLIAIPRNPKNGYRQYNRKEIDKLRVIRLLRRSRYGNMSILRVMQQLDAGETGNLREIIDTPELDESRGYLCFTDNLLSTLENATNAVNKMVVQLTHMQQQLRQNS
jgi:DNA-binding transcriptional MerR regulator